MITFNYLMSQALIILNAKLKKENTAKRVGSLFRDILYFIHNNILGIILKGEKDNEADIKAIANPSKGDTYKAVDTGHYWTYDGIQWNDIGEILPNDLSGYAKNGGSDKTLKQIDEEAIVNAEYLENELYSYSKIENVVRNSGYVNYQTGEIVTSNDYFNYSVDCTGYKKIAVPVVAVSIGRLGYAFTDALGNYISGGQFAVGKYTSGTRVTIEIPENAVEFTGCYYTDEYAKQLGYLPFLLPYLIKDILKVDSSIIEVIPQAYNGQIGLDGKPIKNTNWWYSDFRPAKELDFISGKFTTNTQLSIAFYSDDNFDSFISGITITPGTYDKLDVLLTIGVNYYVISNAYPNGFTYASAIKSDVVYEVMQLKEDFANLMQSKSYSNFVRDSGYVNYQTGEIVTSNDYFNYSVDCRSGKTVSLPVVAVSVGSALGYAFFDEYGNYISGGQFIKTNYASGTRQSIAIPGDAATLVGCYYTNSYANELGFPSFDFVSVIGDDALSKLSGDIVFRSKSDEIYNLAGNSTIISDWQKHKMSHGSMAYFDEYSNDGTMWFGYNADDVNTVENPEYTTGYMVFGKTNIGNIQDIKTWRVLGYGESVGDFTQGNRIPYDINILVGASKVRYYFDAYVNNQVTLASMLFDKATETFSDAVTIHQLKYNVNGIEKTVTIDVDGLMQCWSDFGLTTNIDDLKFTTRLFKYNGYLYTAIGGSFGNAPGMIVRSVQTDGVLWELVTIPNSDIRSMEPQIEIVNDMLYFISRDNAKGICFATYDMNNDVWSDTITLPSGMAKPAIIHFNKRIIIAYNPVKPLVTDWGTVNRNCMTFQEVTYNNGEVFFTELATVRMESGMHYPCFIPHKGSLYMCYSEDKRKLNISQLRSNIGFVKLPF